MSPTCGWWLPTWRGCFVTRRSPRSCAWSGASLAEANQTLERTLGNLRDTQEQLLRSAKLEALGRLAGGVAHDFNNLMTLILGYGSQLERLLDASTREGRWIREITGAGERATDLTQQLMAFGRAHDVELQTVELNATIRNMESMLSRVLGEDSRLILLLEPEELWIRSDQVRLEQVVLNLVVNARDALPHGGEVEIATRWRAPATSGQAREVQLAVSDTGTGMDEETQQRIFEPFFTTKEVGEGNGMGLAIVYGVVAQCNGRIDVTSTLGRGTRFTISLPCVEERAPAGETAAGPALPARPGAVILLVEDDEGIRDLCATVLHEAGYVVTTARHPFEVVDMPVATLAAIDLLLVDVVMPGMAGPDLVEIIRLRRPSLRVLFMSGHGRSKLSALQPDTAETPLLRKPFQPDDLLRHVAQALSTSSAPPASLQPSVPLENTP